jgi:mannose-6-phosphate isomerase-like protein (cupin superfamily)
MRRHLNIGDVQPDSRLSPDDGWVKMDVQWLATRENCGSEFCTVGRTIFRPAVRGSSSMHDMHSHPNAEEIIVVLKGIGRAVSGDEEFPIGPGSVIFIPRNERHLIENTSEVEQMEVIFVYGGAPNLAGAGYKRLELQTDK